MAFKQQHIIKQQVLEVEMQDPPDAFAFRNRLGELYHDKIFPKLDEVFNDACANGELISIDTLVIDVGTIDILNWEEELVSKSISQLKEQLFYQKESFVENASMNVKSGSDKMFSVSATTVEEKEQDILSVADSAHFIKIFFYFMQYGSLPWNAKHLSKQLFLQRTEAVLLNEETLFKEALLVFLHSANEYEIKRLVFQLPSNVVDRIISLLLYHYSIEQTIYDDITAKFRKQLLLVTNNAAIKDLLRRAFFAVIQEKSFSKKNFKQDFAKKIAAIAEEESLSVKEIVTLLRELEIEEPLQAAAREQEKKQGIKRTSEELYIYNAGLVLLHPYLVPLFRNLELMDDHRSQFKDEYASSIAVLLSQYLVTGEREVPEYDLILNKILCGIKLEEPVMNADDIEGEVFEEAGDMLRQVNELWKMKDVAINGSIENLRASFLQRAGKLMQKEKGWLLQVEQKPYDIVLSSLPWGISIIKNELMKEILWVEWA